VGFAFWRAKIVRENDDAVPEPPKPLGHDRRPTRAIGLVPAALLAASQVAAISPLPIKIPIALS